jgi:hypothetical protein
MAVRWIGDAARDLGISPLDAVELLSRHQNYPMNGLLDEDRVLLLKRYAHERKGVESSGGSRAKVDSGATQQTAKVAQQPRTPDATAVTAVTSPIETLPDRSEDRTVIVPPPLPHG